LICIGLCTESRPFTVIFTVKVRSTSIGAGLRAARPEVIFRDLSTPATIVDTEFFDHFFAVTMPHEQCS
jgi:hypothetical protein